MKFINNIPQFDERTWIDSHPSKINDQLREAFAERVCVKCIEAVADMGTPENAIECMRTGMVERETFSCSAWVKKEG